LLLVAFWGDVKIIVFFLKKNLQLKIELKYICTHKSGSSSVGRAPAFQAGCREFEPRLPLQNFDVSFKRIITCGSSSVGRAPAFQAGCREFEPRLPLRNFDVSFKRIITCGSSSVGRAPAFQAGCREFEPRLPLHKKKPQILFEAFLFLF
jgi:hypothetical protein